MKHVLLGSTAIVGGLIASPAFAADQIKLGVGGFFREAYQVVIDDDGEGEPGNEHNTDGFFNDAEVHFNGSTVLDNGLTVGARVEIEGETDSDQIDEAWIYFSGGFGEVHIGSDDEALGNACLVPPGGTTNFSAFSPNQWGANNAPLATSFSAFSTNAVCAGVDDRSDAQKILYVSPIFAGFQLSVSYTPNGGDERHTDGVGPHIGMPLNADTESRHNVSAYVTYTYEGDNWGLAAGAGGSWEGHVEQVVGPDRKEQNFYQAGLNFVFGDLSLGGAFEYFKDSASFSGVQDVDIWVAGAGISYMMNAWTIGAQFSHQDSQGDGEGGVDDFDFQLDRAVLTSNYIFGPGINIDAELAYTWADTDPEASDGVDDYQAFEFGIGTAITF